MKSLLITPFVGEFGWELMHWAPLCRAISEGYDKVVAYQMHGRQHLYKDFATICVPVAVRGGQPDMWNRTGLYQIDGDNAIVWSPEFNLERYDTVLDPNKTTIMSPDRKFRPMNSYYGLREQDEFDVLLHARSDPKPTYRKENRNWPIGKWAELVQLLKRADPKTRIASIGSLEESHHVPDTSDIRGIPLKALSLYMNHALITVGPSSGPMHFASLCRCPHMVWTDKEIWNMGLGRKGTNRERYQDYWNPFKTECWVIDHEGWQPKVKTVFDELAHHINQLTDAGGSEARREKL